MVFLKRIDEPGGEKKNALFQLRLLSLIFFSKLPQGRTDEHGAFIQNDLVKQIIFIMEIEVEGALCHACLFNHFVNCGSVHAFANKEIIGFLNHSNTLCAFFILQCRF